MPPYKHFIIVACALFVVLGVWLVEPPAFAQATHITSCRLRCDLDVPYCAEHSRAGVGQEHRDMPAIVLGIDFHDPELGFCAGGWGIGCRTNRRDTVCNCLTPDGNTGIAIAALLVLQ